MPNLTVEKLHHTCFKLEIPLAAHKSEEPSTSITFLDIEIDNFTGELRLPAEKLDHICRLPDWEDNISCTHSVEDYMVRTPINY